jgi:hypothetical protein
MLLGHRSKNPPLFWVDVQREFTMAHLLCQIANVTVHYRPEFICLSQMDNLVNDILS